MYISLLRGMYIFYARPDSDFNFNLCGLEEKTMGRKANRVSIKYPVLILVILAFIAGSAAGAFAELRIDRKSVV